VIDLKVGTTETLLIDVKDTLGNLSDLNDGGPIYDVYDANDVQKYNGAVATVDPSAVMTAHCLVNTTGWTPGHYRLYLRFVAAPDSPRVGPFEFKVNP
jgi:hypothetical protein